MNWKTYLIRFAGLVVIAAAGSYLYAITFHALQGMGQIHVDMENKAFASILTIKTTYVWMASVIAGFISIFIKDNWRYVLYLSPLYAPPLFAAIFTLVQE